MKGLCQFIKKMFLVKRVIEIQLMGHPYEQKKYMRRVGKPVKEIESAVLYTFLSGPGLIVSAFGRCF